MEPNQRVIFTNHGGPEVLKLVSEELGDPADDEVMVKHEAIGVNFVETYFRSGLYNTKLPSGLGTEAAGIILKIGNNVTEFKIGDRVAYVQGPLGSYSVKRNIPSRYLVKVPPGVTMEEAAGGLLKGLTVYYLFHETYPLKKGQTILFHAAAGGVGLIACQWARHLGVKLIGTVSTSEKALLAKSNGASEIINYSFENVPERVAELTSGNKVPVVYDGVGRSTWEMSLDSLAPRGLLVSFGNASGPVTNVDLGILSQKGSLYVTRPILATYIDTPEKLQEGASEVFNLISQKIIHIAIDRKFKLEEAFLAHEYIANRNSMGSTVLIP